MSALFSGRFATLYDAFYAKQEPARDVAWIIEQCVEESAAPRRVLDVACGTGRHAEAFLNEGVDVVGLDASADMISLARLRAPAASFAVADMTALDANATMVDADGFDCAICLGDALGYAKTNDRVRATIRGMTRAVRPGGLVVAEVWHAAAMLSHSEDVRTRRLTGEVVRESRTVLEVARQVARVEWILTHPGNADCRETHEVRFFGVQEIALFFSIGGLEIQSVTAGYNQKEPDDASFHLVAVGAKREGCVAGRAGL